VYFIQYFLSLLNNNRAQGLCANVPARRCFWALVSLCVDVSACRRLPLPLITSLKFVIHLRVGCVSIQYPLWWVAIAFCILCVSPPTFTHDQLHRTWKTVRVFYTVLFVVTQYQQGSGSMRQCPCVCCLSPPTLLAGISIIW
jgi:hypothetical protein